MRVNPTFLPIALLLLQLPLAGQGQEHTRGTQVAPFTQTLRPGDYDWHPELSPRGPVVVLVSLADQLLYVYRNGVRIARSTVSSGKPGKETPTGLFTVLQKKERHTSSIYKGAQMPHMQRLTWSGIAVHAGPLPGYPASAGCVRLPVAFAARLFTVTRIGTTVIIADNRSAPAHTVSPGLLFSGTTGRHPAASYSWKPSAAPAGPVSVVLSAPDQKMFVYRNGVEIGRAPVGLGGVRVDGTYIYSADAAVDAAGRRDWIFVTSLSRRQLDLSRLEERLQIDPAFLSQVRGVVTAGSTLVVTNTPVNAQTKSGSGFNIMTAVR